MTAALSPSAWLRWETIRDHVLAHGPSSILELGIGGGAAGSRLATMVDIYVGFEPDARARAVAERRMPAGADVIDDTAAIDGRHFAMVCAFEVLEHVEDDRDALRTWVDHVEVGGHLLLSTPAFAHRMGAMDRRVGHHRRYDPAVMEAMLAEAGLVDVDVTLVGFPLGHVLEAGRNLIARVRPAPETASMAERSATSGRTLQPPEVPWLTRYGTAPFRMLARRFPDRGTGLVAIGRRAQ